MNKKLQTSGTFSAALYPRLQTWQATVGMVEFLGDQH